MKTDQKLLQILLIFSLMIFGTQLAAQDSQNCTLIGRWAHGPCCAIDAVGNIAYFGDGGYLRIMDFSDPANPVELGRMLTQSTI